MRSGIKAWGLKGTGEYDKWKAHSVVVKSFGALLDLYISKYRGKLVC
jgi:hypothetical protein